MDSAEAFKIGPELEVTKIEFDPTSRLRVRKNPDGEAGDIFIDVSRTTVDPRSVTKDGSLSVALRSTRKIVAQSVFC